MVKLKKEKLLDSINSLLLAAEQQNKEIAELKKQIEAQTVAIEKINQCLVDIKDEDENQKNILKQRQDEAKEVYKEWLYGKGI